MAYVDDLQNASSNTEGLKAASENLRTLEETKGYTFNTEPNKTAILIVNKKRNKNYEDIKLNLKKGEIKQTNEYKYLGEWYNDKGDHSTTIKKRESKIGYYVQQVKVYGNDFLLKNYTLNARLKLYKTIVIPSLYYNIETWSTMTQNELKQLEGMQYKILRKITEQKQGTPYFGLLAETGVWPVEQQIEIRKIMLLNNIMNSKRKRLVKEIMEEQMKNPWKNCWIEELGKIIDKYDITIEEVITSNRYDLKEKAEQKIQEHLEKMLNENTKTKLRFIKEFKKKEYITNMQFQGSIIMMKTRLNMIEVKCNYKNKYKNNLKCELCKKEEDNTEHLIFNCEIVHPHKGILDAKDIETCNERVPREINEILKRREELGYKISI